jgi:hypothetical protein
MTLDRWLGVIGLVIGLPGFAALFLGPDQATAISFSLVGVVLIAAAATVNYFGNLPPFSVKSAEVLLDFQDDTGKLAKLSKSYRIRPNYSYLQTLVHKNIGADGVIRNICWDDQPVPPQHITERMKEYIVTIQFPFPLRKWREVLGKLSYELVDSFENNPDGLTYCVDFPTKLANIRVSFPSKRPCIKAHAFLGQGAGEKPISEPSVTDNGRRLELVLNNPDIGSRYNIYWDW